ncbi:unnamed protein product, partial [Anisakis simplex]|uniref:SCP domain-containing protein n=1 Tax=Anisakis simplex TaxID=6269 RepID=A0A0M3J0M9_ANISI
NSAFSCVRSPNGHRYIAFVISSSSYGVGIDNTLCCAYGCIPFTSSDKYVHRVYNDQRKNSLQMAWGPTSKLGCGVSHCPLMTPGYNSTIYVVCHYSDGGNYKGELIYDSGIGCNGDLDCNAFRGSKCEPGTNLCIAPLAI